MLYCYILLVLGGGGVQYRSSGLVGRGWVGGGVGRGRVWDRTGSCSHASGVL